MSGIFIRPVTQEQRDEAQKRRAEKINEQVQLANDYVLTDLMARIAELERKTESKP